MADKNNYTTIRIKEDSRKKLEALKEGTSLTLSDVIENLLSNVGGTVRDDVVNIKRPAVAFQLQFIDFENDKGAFRDVTYQDLAGMEVGTIIEFDETPSKNCQIETGTLIFKDDESAFVRVTEILYENGTEKRYSNLLHIDLF